MSTQSTTTTGSPAPTTKKELTMNRPKITSRLTKTQLLLLFQEVNGLRGRGWSQEQEEAGRKLTKAVLKESINALWDAVDEEKATEARSEVVTEEQAKAYEPGLIEHASANKTHKLEALCEGLEDWPEEDYEREAKDKELARYLAEQKRKNAEVSTKTSKKKDRRVLAGDDPREVYGFTEDSKERVDFTINVNGTTKVNSTGEVFSTVRKAAIATRVEMKKCNIWIRLFFIDETGAEQYADALRANPKGYKKGGKGGRSRLSNVDRADRAWTKAMVKVTKLKAKLKAAEAAMVEAEDACHAAERSANSEPALAS